MNILEHYIKEVHDVRELELGKWDSEPWVEVDLTTNCWGSIRRTTWTLTAKSWAKAQNLGYVMG